MNADERARMRDTLRAALGHALLPEAHLEHPGPFQGPPSGTADDLLNRFRAQLTALGGAVHEADTPDAIAEIVSALALAEAARVAAATQPSGPSSNAAQTVLTWDDDRLPVPGVAAALARRGVRIQVQNAGSTSSAEGRRDLAGALVGLTGAEAGLAETGSIVVASGPGRGRLASLLPPIHVALLDRRALIESLPVLIARRPELMTSGANVVCITGPSRTADIEHTLSRGVHGPREVHVVLVNR